MVKEELDLKNIDCDQFLKVEDGGQVGEEVKFKPGQTKPTPTPVSVRRQVRTWLESNLACGAYGRSRKGTLSMMVTKLIHMEI
jgi:hypothetical protein